MEETGPQQIAAWVDPRLVQLADAAPAEQIGSDMPAGLKTEGVALEDLRGLAREANRVLQPEPASWARYISSVFPEGDRDRVVFGILGLGRSAEQLDDLFGERASGWARQLTTREIADLLAEPVGWWALEDMSRVGYLEAWAARGENPLKKRLAVMATRIFNLGGRNNPSETFQVLRHLMDVDAEPVVEAVADVMGQLDRGESVERFLAWWAPRVPRDILERIVSRLDDESRERVLSLA